MNNSLDGSYINRITADLDRAIHRLSSLKELILVNYEKIGRLHPDDPIRIEAELSIAGLILLYETYARPTTSFIAQTKETPKELTSKTDVPKIAFAVDGDWVTHELSRFLGALNYLHNVFTLNGKLKDKNIGYRLERPVTRLNVYRDAKLFYYLERNEELRIAQIHIASPGLVEFIVSNTQYGAMLVTLVVLLSRSAKIADTIITLWAKFKDTLRDQRRKDRMEEIEKSIHEFFTKEVLPRYINMGVDVDTKSLQEIESAIAEFSKRNLTDPIATTDHIFRAIATLAHLSSSQKLRALESGKESN